MGAVWKWLIALLLLVIIGLLIALLLRDGGDPDPAPSETASPTATATPTDSGEPTPAFVARAVTSGAHIPSAVPLSADVMATVGTGWVVAIHDSDSYDDGGSYTPGPALLYLIAPDGVRYELANLDTLGLDTPNIVAWNTERNAILMSEDRAELKTFNMTTGSFDASWAFCGEGGSVRGAAYGDDWLVRGVCSGEGIDGVYTDTGDEVPGEGIVGQGFGMTVFDVGDVQVLNEFESLASERFVAYYADGTSANLPIAGSGDCYPLGKGGGATLAAYCYTAQGGLEVWELPVDGSAPQLMVSAAQIADYHAAQGGEEDVYVDGYCRDSVLPVMQFHHSFPTLGVLYGGEIQKTVAPPFEYRTCYEAVGTAALIAGGGPLWFTDFDTGATVELLPGAGADFPLYVVGTDGYLALRHP